MTRGFGRRARLTPSVDIGEGHIAGIAGLVCLLLLLPGDWLATATTPGRLAREVL